MKIKKQLHIILRDKYNRDFTDIEMIAGLRRVIHHGVDTYFFNREKVLSV